MDKDGRNFSAAIRRLIETNGMILDEVRQEIADIKRQISILQKNGVKVEVQNEVTQRETACADKNQPTLTVGSNFVTER